MEGDLLLLLSRGLLRSRCGLGDLRGGVLLREDELFLRRGALFNLASDDLSLEVEYDLDRSRRPPYLLRERERDLAEGEVDLGSLRSRPRRSLADLDLRRSFLRVSAL